MYESNPRPYLKSVLGPNLPIEITVLISDLGTTQGQFKFPHGSVLYQISPNSDLDLNSSNCVKHLYVSKWVVRIFLELFNGIVVLV
jgi:hypothetical protein